MLLTGETRRPELLTLFDRVPALVAVLGGYLVLVSADGGTQLLVAGKSFENWTGMPAAAFSFLLLAILLVLNLSGVDIFARVQIPIIIGLLHGRSRARAPVGGPCGAYRQVAPRGRRRRS